ncbi:transmembrane channel-like protein 7 isoform X3 [Macrobrachium nipponense]|uniref:transmembrane channel-like protein 7 isoform X3 n=1 Tax=Macrobrachium nipponense TaxID=159736 RepID=UPI0030C858FA
MMGELTPEMRGGGGLGEEEEEEEDEGGGEEKQGRGERQRLLGSNIGLTTKSGKRVTIAVFDVDAPDGPRITVPGGEGTSDEDQDEDDDEGIVITFNTLGRGTIRRRASTRSRRCQPTTTTATLVHTSRRGSDTYLEVLPDLTQGVDEEETWEKLQQIRAHAVPMEEKRKLKRQLQSAPTLRTRGLAAFKLSRRKFTMQAKSRLKEMISKIELWHWSLRYVEGNFGTGLVAFFTFIKWLLYLNLVTCVLLTLFILVPQIILKHPEDRCSLDEYDNNTWAFEDENATVCCYEDYRREVLEESQHTDQAFLVKLVLDGVQGTGVLEISYLFYGFYPRHILLLEEKRGWTYNLPLAYLLVMVVTLVLSLVLMVRAAARGLRKSLRSSEGQFYQYCNLIFGGWDYCIENNKAASVKKKAIYNELCNHLETERYNEEKEQRTKRERCRLYFVRLLVNLVVLILLAGSFSAIFYSTSFAFRKLRTLKTTESKGGRQEDIIILLFEYLPSAVIITLNIVIPFILRLLVEFEHYTPNFILVLTLIRTVFLRLASLVVLLFSIYQGIQCPAPLPGSCINDECDSQPSCWETYVGQQLYKLSILDLLIMFLTTFFINLPRKFIGHKLLRRSRLGSIVGDIEFMIPKHVLDIVYGQTLCWLGMFYSPLLPAVTCVKLVFVFYIKYFDLTVNSSQSSQLYRTSRSNSLFISILLVSFIVTIVPVGYSIAEITPSVSCGPFRGLNTIWSQMIRVISELPHWLQSVVFFMGTAGFAVPAIIILILAWYYYYAVGAANKHMVSLLKNQLILEGHDKQFLLSRLDQMIKKAAEEDATARSSRSIEDETGHGNDQTLEA